MLFLVIKDETYQNKQEVSVKIIGWMDVNSRVIVTRRKMAIVLDVIS